MQNKTILIINGPNLNMLGHRQKDIYGYKTIHDLKNECNIYALSQGFSINFLQSNREYEIIEWIQDASSKNYCGLIINPAAYSHYSIAILDSLLCLDIPIIEVHLSDIKSRESFRKESITGQAASNIIYGKGFSGYIEALKEMILLNQENLLL